MYIYIYIYTFCFFFCTRPNKKGYNIKVSPQHINLDSDLTLTMLDSEILVKIKRGYQIGVSVSFTLPLHPKQYSPSGT